MDITEPKAVSVVINPEVVNEPIEDDENERKPIKWPTVIKYGVDDNNDNNDTDDNIMVIMMIIIRMNASQSNGPTSSSTMMMCRDSIHDVFSLYQRYLYCMRCNVFCCSMY